MSQIINTLPTQGTQHIIKSMKSVIYGLSRSVNHYNILVTHAGDQPSEVFTLNKKEVARIELCANHCEVIFKPSRRKAILFLPYDAIKVVHHFKKVEPEHDYLYCADKKYRGYANRVPFRG